jgi:hypothetical protein
VLAIKFRFDWVICDKESCRIVFVRFRAPLQPFKGPSGNILAIGLIIN